MRVALMSILLTGVVGAAVMGFMEQALYGFIALVVGGFLGGFVWMMTEDIT